jgi:hypothetical protein
MKNELSLKLGEVLCRYRLRYWVCDFMVVVFLLHACSKIFLCLAIFFILAREQAGSISSLFLADYF